MRNTKKISQELIDSILELHSKGNTTLQISEELSLKTDTVNKYLKLYGLKSNRLTQKSVVNVINEKEALCSECKLVRDISYFQWGRKGGKNPYRFSYCNDCRNNKTKSRLRNSFHSYITSRLGTIRRSNPDLPFDLDLQFVLDLWGKQEGKCFYTEVPMIFGQRKNLDFTSMSLDKIIPELGYTKGNVVLCTCRANSIKYNQTLEEMKVWMPNWYDKLRKAKFVTVI